MSAVVVPYGQLEQAFNENPNAVQDAVDRAATNAAGGDAAKKAQYVGRFNQALSSLQQADQGDKILSTPQDDLASRLQTMLVDRASAAGKVQTAVDRSTVTTTAGDSTAVETVQVKFNENDLIGWLGTGLEIIFDSDKAPFKAPPDAPEAIPDHATIALFSDWGTGLYGAPVIADSIRKLPACDVVLHLGDTYYSGTKTEVSDRLVATWPTRPGAISRALNGNHEMYSGGVGYFEALASFFKQSSSCVALQNTNWLILGLDTAYEDFAISATQLAWINKMVAAAGTRKVILCSHHQPFSSLDDQGPNLQTALGPLLDAGRIEAWFWGHEHRLVIYEPHSKWGVKGRCIGHGGFPAFRDTAIGAHGDLYNWIHLHQRPHAPEAMLLDGPNFWVTAAPGQYSPHGFVVLELDGTDAWEAYRTPDNIAVGPKSKL
jgi:Calcineurin-like phosphoesterase